MDIQTGGEGEKENRDVHFSQASVMTSQSTTSYFAPPVLDQSS